MGTLTLSASPLLWEQFLAGALDREGGARSEPHPILARWQRSRMLGAPSTGLPDEGPSVGHQALIERRARLEPVWHELGGMMEVLAAAPLPSGRVALLADPDGVILATRTSGGDFRDHADAVRLIEGARWDETSRGTNAIGTALTESSSVAVVGPAHYAQRHHGLVCYAAPVHDPFGELVCVLDVTGPANAADPIVLVAVVSMAYAAEARLREVAWARVAVAARGGIEARLAREDGPVLIVEAPGRVRHANGAARVLLGDEAGASTMGVLGLSWQELKTAALRGEPLEVRPSERGTPWRVHAEAVGESGGGATLAVLVRLEPLVSRTRSAEAPTAATPESGAWSPTTAGSEPWTSATPGRGPHVAATSESGAWASATPSRGTALPGNGPWAALKGSDPHLCATLREAARFAPTALPVLLLSETGTGKELLARALHSASAVASGPFVAVNCGALSPSLLESELFGHAPGAFTGARSGGADGKLAAADGGTLFLDELAEMPPALQVLLLRVLEDGSYSRVGESRVRHSRFRLIGATCKDLEAAVRAGTFRSDLYYRLQGAMLRLPPLRERSDLGELAQAILDGLAESSAQVPPSLSPAALARLSAHRWPGNVRELKTVLRLALVRAAGASVLDVDALPPDLGMGPALGVAQALRPAEPTPTQADETGPRALRELEAHAIQDALARSGGNVAQAARRLGIARSTLYRMVERFGLTLPPRS
ncbi:sigma-54-dependent Fis family transcriptional regulator [Pyxidicoccus parkwayensis]|uniref:Sigma-54-dependent Fis family transcriptional regulator n=1 Tax=Pyxidicoccus parkwayensis TaxID=2813578 RepID=A0ABX7NXM8_9BACT|nr:sigma-54-dependent Fis family transcriptional regulator [Pyxidicoccus parkwaysis]QSQ23555.1 sigma-54-dependent Fis family transcriptional regulator [Pyxidicoccus parkwaysis]